MNEEDLRKYIEFTKSLLDYLQGNPEYSWFFESFNLEVVNTYFQNGNGPVDSNKLESITKSDVSRIKTYLNFIDRKAINYGKVFYQNISDNSLKNELIADFKEMKIALKNDNLIEFGRRLFLQLENIFNFSLSNLNVYNLISSAPMFYRSVTPNWPNYRGRPFNFYNSFFYQNRNTNQEEPVELSRVSFNTKSIFLSIHFNYQVNARNINDIYFLRNKGSHRYQLSPSDKQKLDRILSEFDKNYSFYYKVLFDVVNGIPNIT